MGLPGCMFVCLLILLLVFFYLIELFIDHLNITHVSENGDLDLDLQGQIGLQTWASKNFHFNCLTLSHFKFYLLT